MKRTDPFKDCVNCMNLMKVGKYMVCIKAKMGNIYQIPPEGCFFKKGGCLDFDIMKTRLLGGDKK